MLRASCAVRPKQGSSTVSFSQSNVLTIRGRPRYCSNLPAVSGQIHWLRKAQYRNRQGSLRSVLLREYDELHLRGLKIIGLPPTREMLDVVKERGLPVLYHARRVSEFEELAHVYPTVYFIVAHLGSDESSDWREHLAAIELAKRCRNLHLDTSTIVLTEFRE